MTARTMVYLETEQIEELRRRAHQERASVTELIRRAVRDFLGGQQRTPASPDVYRRIVAVGHSGVGDIADNHDRYLAEALSHKHSSAP
jgi:hypothetical protein